MPPGSRVDGFRVEGAAKPLALVGATGAKTMLPADFASAAVAGAVNNLVYLRYVASPAKAISADGLALVDVTRGNGYDRVRSDRNESRRNRDRRPTPMGDRIVAGVVAGRADS